MAIITEDYVSFEIAKLLKDKGFNEECFALYNPDGMLIQSGIRLNNIQVGRVEGSYSAPTLQMAMKWLRIKHNIHIESFCPVVDATDEPVKYNVVISDLRNYCLAFNTPLEDKEFDSYEKACEAAIKYCLENLI